jgi:hypothetical protein
MNYCNLLVAGLRVDDILNSLEYELLQNLFAGLSVDSVLVVLLLLKIVITW